MINKKAILGISLAAVAAMIATPAFAGAGPAPVDDLVWGKIWSKGAVFITDHTTPVPRHGEVFGGYGILSDGALVVVTSHQGFYDSESQIPPAGDSFGSPFVEVCAPTDFPSCGAEWHSHMAELTEARATSDCSANSLVNLPALEIAALTYENPAIVQVEAHKIYLQKIMWWAWFTESVSGEVRTFDAGTTDGNLLSFNIRADTSVNPPAFCVEDVKAINTWG